MELGTLGGFFFASLLLGIAPGPDNLYVLSQSALYGARAGLSVTAGLCTGLLVHTSSVALGMTALIVASQTAYTVIKVAGAMYLCYLAWCAFSADGSSTARAVPPQVGGWALYRRGIAMNVSNPKVTVFFLAFLPQFADPDRGAMGLQLVLLGLVFIAATILVFGAVSVLAGRIGRWVFGSERATRWLNRATGGLFVLLAVRVLASDR